MSLRQRTYGRNTDPPSEYHNLLPDTRAELPTEEVLERQRESTERVVQPPDYDRLMPYSSATT